MATSDTLANYSNSNLLPLDNAHLRKLCPAAFAEAPRSDVSARYGFVPTMPLVEALRKAGFVPTQVNSYMRRNADAAEFTKHMIRFRPEGDNLKKLTKGDVVPQIILVNSHDRSSQFQLFGGLWRLVCSNGLMVSDGAKVEPMVIRHTVSSIDGLLDAAGNLIKQQKFVFDHVEAMRKTVLTEKQALLFAEQALNLRPTRAGAIDSAQLLQVRRPEDDGFSLWNVFNRAQENLMKGGLTGVTGNNRAVVTRVVTSVNADMHINAGMWRLAMEAIGIAAASSAAAVRKSSKAAAKATADAT